MNEPVRALTPSCTLGTLLAVKHFFTGQESLAVLQQVLAQLSAMHKAGVLHRSIGPDTVSLTAAGEAVLAAPDPVCYLWRGADNCPPEGSFFWPLEVPARLDQARKALARAKKVEEFDPRRIDVYQAGGLLCRLVTGRSALAYLSSPRVFAQVPRPIRPLVDRGLGYNPANRIPDCEQYIFEVETVRRKGI